MNWSQFAARLSGETGIMELMDDMGRVLASGDTNMVMLGGGSPAEIPAMTAIWHTRFEEILREERGVQRLVTQYDTPQGQPSFHIALAELLAERFGWRVTEKNIGVTNGSQTAFFLLLNMLTGEYPGGTPGKVLFPLLPEYLGYADQALQAGSFVACRPVIEATGDHSFKYHIDFAAVEAALQDPSIRAVVVSRPTNPSGNVLTDAEVQRLDTLTQEREIPLIVDNAYGMPFPHIIFEDLIEGSARPRWNENIVLGMSLSKIGLPGVRTGIVVAREEIITALSRANAVLSLANTMTGQVLVEPLIRSGALINHAHEIIQPFYRQRMEFARATMAREMNATVPWAIHRPQGSLFLWLHIRDLPITSRELYQRLKAAQVLVVPGEYFFFGDSEITSWSHARECLRLNYGQEPEAVERGLRIIARELTRL